MYVQYTLHSSALKITLVSLQIRTQRYSSMHSYTYAFRPAYPFIQIVYVDFISAYETYAFGVFTSKCTMYCIYAFCLYLPSVSCESKK